MRNLKVLVSFVILVSLASCKNQEKGNSQSLSIPNQKPKTYQLKHAEGFSIKSNKNFKVLTIKNPWPESNKTYRYALIDRQDAPKITLNRDEFDAIILTPIERIVVTSTTHVPALELLGAEQSLVGFPGTEYISSKKTRELINANEIRELGQNEELNTEVLLDLEPDAVIAFGVDGSNKSMNTVQKSGIPVIFNGDWVEKTPLAKAEWIKFFGILFNKEQRADSIFNSIERDYQNAKTLASKAEKKPTVLCGAMQKDVWYLPQGTSPEAQFLKDANLNYLWGNTEGKGSLALSFEVVFEKAKDAELWLSPSYYTSLEALKEANTHYTQFQAFKNKNVYSFSNTTGETGGVLYYELGIARPDLVLKDIIKISHPGFMENYEMTFFEKLE